MKTLTGSDDMSYIYIYVWKLQIVQIVSSSMIYVCEMQNFHDTYSGNCFRLASVDL